MKLKELPIMERPYEKLEMYGAECLSTAELVAIIIKSGTKDLTSVEVAQELLKDDVMEKGIAFLKDVSIEELVQKKGIGRVKAIQLKAISELAIRASKPVRILRRKIDMPEEAAKILMPDFKGEKQEVVKTILLDNRNQIIKIVTIAIGGINSSSVEVREVYKEPIKTNAAKIILAHNHPSGDTTPSIEDIKFTRKINEAGRVFGIELMDHIIIGDGTFCSLKRLKNFVI